MKFTLFPRSNGIILAEYCPCPPRTGEITGASQAGHQHQLTDYSPLQPAPAASQPQTTGGTIDYGSSQPSQPSHPAEAAAQPQAAQSYSPAEIQPATSQPAAAAEHAPEAQKAEPTGSGGGSAGGYRRRRVRV